jgi:hypothetical protein
MEVWKPAVGYEGIYEVSSAGRVRRIKNPNPRTGGILASVVHSRGYVVVKPSVGGVSPMRRVHRLVCAAFHGPCPEGHQCNHKNGIKTDNRAENLEWVTPSENVLHANRLGIGGRGERNGRAKLTQKQADKIRVSVGTAVSLAAKYGVSNTLIAMVRQGKIWNHSAR